MLSPNPGSLIHSLRGGLKDAVLPALEKGDAQRQLKAAIHLLGRLEKSWDLYSQHVQQDNNDIETTLAAIFNNLGEVEASERFKQLRYQLNHRERVVKQITGINEPALVEDSHRNLQLQECLQALGGVLAKADLDESIQRICTEKLTALYRRMAARDAVYVGDRPPGGGQQILSET